MEKPKPYVITLVGAESSGKTTLARQLADLYGCPWVPEYAREYLEGLGKPYQERDLVVMAERQLEAIERALGGFQTAAGSPQLAVGSRQSSVGCGQSAVLNWQSSIGSPQLAVDSSQLVVDSRVVSGENIELSVSDIHTFISGLMPEAWISDSQQRPMIIVDGGMLTFRLWARIKYGTKIPIVEEALERDVTSLYLLCRPTIPWEPDPWREAPLLLDRVWIYNQYLMELGKSSKEFYIVNSRVEKKAEHQG